MRPPTALAAAAVGLAALAGAASAAGPAVLSVPQVSGTARVGSQLTADAGSWSGAGTLRYAYRWSRCDAFGRRCAVVAGATGPTYGLTAADAGRTIGLTVTATDASESATSSAGLVGPVAPARATLASTVRPEVSGSAAAGSTLAVSTGTWTVAPTSLAYAWLRCDATGRACVPVPGASSATYVPSSADVGHALVARLRAAVGPTTQTVLSLPSAPVAAAAATAGRPTIAGVAQVGRRLVGAAPPGAPAGAAVTWQWYRCDAAGAHCSSIHGATARTYLAAAADAGRTLGLAARVAGAAAPAYSSLLGPLAARSAPAASTAQPDVAGTPLEGRRLTASPGSWSTAPAALAYSWRRCNRNGRICEPIAGATGAAYVPTAADVGRALVAVVSARFGRFTLAAFSLATAPVSAAALANLTAPAVGGTLRVGARLTASAGLWAGTPPIAYRYQWSRCDAAGARCSSVHGATAGTYRLVAGDAGHTIALAVAADDGTASRVAYASLVGPVGPAGAAVASTMQPQVSGSPAIGATLTVDGGGWSEKPAATTYQWQRCNANGRVCVPVPGATAASYAVAAADAGHALVAVVSIHAGGVSARAWSTATRPIPPGP